MNWRRCIQKSSRRVFPLFLCIDWRIKILVLTASALLGGLAVGYISIDKTASASPLEKLITDFENKEDIEKWSTDADALKLSREKVKERRFAASLTMHKYVSGKTQWPSMNLSVENGLPADWSGYDVLKIDCFLDAKMGVRLGIVVRTKEGKWPVRPKPYLAPGSWQTVTYSIRHAKNIKELVLFVTRPKQDLTIVVDNIRLVSCLPTVLKELQKQYRRLNAPEVVQDISQTLNAVLSGK